MVVLVLFIHIVSQYEHFEQKKDGGHGHGRQTRNQIHIKHETSEEQVDFDQVKKVSHTEFGELSCELLFLFDTH